MRFEFDPAPKGDKKLKGRFTFFNLGPDRVRQLQEISDDGGITWQTSYDFLYERVPMSKVQKIKNHGESSEISQSLF